MQFYFRKGASGFGFFVIDVGLTDDGYDNVTGTMRLIFKYINWLKNKEVSKIVFDEMAQLSDLRIRFDESYGLEYALRLSKALHYHPFEKVLRAQEISEFSEAAIKNVLRQLSPKQMVVFVISKGCVGTRSEPYYNTKYTPTKFDEPFLEMLASVTSGGFQPPQPNRFIPTNFVLYGQEKNKGRLVQLDGNQFSLWLRQDNEFFLPKIYVALRFQNAAAYASPSTAVMSCLFVAMIKDQLFTITHVAKSAGLELVLEDEKGEMALEFWGFNEKLCLLIQAVVSAIREFEANEVNVTSMKADYLADLEALESKEVNGLAMYHLNRILSGRQWKPDELRLAAEGECCFSNG